MKTPLGKFRIGEKIGADVPSGTIFRSRIPLAPDDLPPPTDDLVLTRILWLRWPRGTQRQHARPLHLHPRYEPRRGDWPAGQPHGCIRMKNADLIALFDQVPLGAKVVISTQKRPRISLHTLVSRLNSPQQPAKEGRRSL